MVVTLNGWTARVTPNDLFACMCQCDVAYIASPSLIVSSSINLSAHTVVVVSDLATVLV